MQISDKVLWRSFKIIDKWYEGEIIFIKYKKQTTEYHIKTTISGSVTTIIRYPGDVKAIN